MGFDTEMPLVDTEANRPPARRGALGDDPLRARATGSLSLEKLFVTRLLKA